MALTEAPILTADPIERIEPEWVIFSCSGERFAIRLTYIREILLPQPVTRLPGCGPEVCGLAGLRGRILTVLDFGAALGLNPSIEVPDHRLLLIDRGEDLVAGAVDEIIAITHEAERELDLDELLGRILA